MKPLTQFKLIRLLKILLLFFCFGVFLLFLQSCFSMYMCCMIFVFVFIFVIFFSVFVFCFFFFFFFFFFLCFFFFFFMGGGGGGEYILNNRNPPQTLCYCYFCQKSCLSFSTYSCYFVLFVEWPGYISPFRHYQNKPETNAEYNRFYVTNHRVKLIKNTLCTFKIKLFLNLHL